ncbi:MAG: hypothetical protein AUG09_03500 [Acidobacteria bacterium 13_1_20CM_2_68_7]|nr:MAG: hypothetical protein AUG09_03500 [Acidobacteria bacterium 13_1_20CM_2_68_7]
MAHIAKPEEEKLLAAEEAMPQEVADESLPLCQLKIVYLGSHPKKTERLKGMIQMDSVEEPEGGSRRQTHLNHKIVKEGYTLYDFARQDSRGRLRKDRMTEDGKRWEPCMNLRHALMFYRMRDPDKQPVYQVKGTTEQLALLKWFISRRRAGGAEDMLIAHPDADLSGPKLLSLMEDVLPAAG